MAMLAARSIAISRVNLAAGLNPGPALPTLSVMRSGKESTLTQSQTAEATFLPDFCGIRIVLSVVVIGEMLALLLALGPVAVAGDRLAALGVISLYVQWVALTGTAALCYARRWLRRLDDVPAATVAYLMLLATTALLGFVTIMMAEPLGLDLVLADGWQRGFVLRSVAIGAIASAIALRYFYVRHQWQRQVLAESRAHYMALQARIRPHFLFNSLNTIASLTNIDPPRAEEALVDLADLFRASLAGDGGGVKLENELALGRRYLNIEHLRLGARLQVVWDLEGLDDSALMPPLVIQPLLENAVHHGIEPLPDGGEIRIVGRRSGGSNELRIENPQGTGDAHHDGNRMALENIRERLAAYYARNDVLSINDSATHYTVTLRLPDRGA